MKHGIYYAYWDKEWEGDYVYYAAKAARLGFDILEIGLEPLPGYTAEQIKELKKAAQEGKITLTAGYGPCYERNVGARDLKIRKNALQWFERAFEVMDALDIHFLGGGIYSYWPVDYSKEIKKEEDWKYSVEGVGLLAEKAKQHGITLGMEALNRFEGYLLNTAEEGVRFVKEVDCDNVRLMLDTFHMNIEETSIGGAIRTAGKYLGHFHTGECNRMTPGQGRMPWREIGEALRDIGYQGDAVMEPFVRMGGTIGKDIKIWRDLSRGASEEQLDKEARDALIFQRYMLDGFY